ncbi:MAG: hypothetical protein Kow0075_05730 [Salibacteraceae bacterium]
MSQLFSFRLFKRQFGGKENIHLFILAPPFSGSTLLAEVVATSPNVSLNNEHDQKEGMLLPGGRALYGTFEQRWDPQYKYNWGKIYALWGRYWDFSKKILLEKSPPLIIRAEELQKRMRNPFFLILVRDPYAHIESLMRRRDWTAEKSAEYSMMCLKYQLHNATTLQNKHVVRYEDMTTNPVDFAQGLIKFLPQLQALNTEKLFTAHNFKNRKMKLVNLNEEKIDRINPSDLSKINQVLSKYHEELSFFGYGLLEAQ